MPISAQRRKRTSVGSWTLGISDSFPAWANMSIWIELSPTLRKRATTWSSKSSSRHSRTKCGKNHTQKRFCWRRSGCWWGICSAMVPYCQATYSAALSTSKTDATIASWNSTSSGTSRRSGSSSAITSSTRAAFRRPPDNVPFASTNLKPSVSFWYHICSLINFAFFGTFALYRIYFVDEEVVKCGQTSPQAEPIKVNYQWIDYWKC